MKKHELLKKAFEDYPEGTKFLQLKSKTEILSSGKFSVTMGNGCFGITDDVNSNGVYSSVKKEWAEVVKPKIAVKVENEKEFNSLMKYYDGLNILATSGCKASELEYERYEDLKPSLLIANIGSLILPNKDGYLEDGNEDYSPDNYQIIPFSDFAKEHNIKLPNFQSNDGVDIYEMDNFWWVQKVNGEYQRPVESCLRSHKPANDLLTFSTKQAALDWIESQKPKEIKLDCGVVNKTGLIINPKYTFMEKWELENVLKAMQELS